MELARGADGDAQAQEAGMARIGCVERHVRHFAFVPLRRSSPRPERAARAPKRRLIFASQPFRRNSAWAAARR